jgi:DMSO reductase anchor subunit
MLKEWPLVAFTVIGQLAAGIFIFIGGPLFMFGPTNGESAAPSARLPVLLAVLGFMAAAAAVSLFHLRRPARAYNVLSNIGTSWLSREILAELIFMALVGLLAYCEWSGTRSPGLIKGLFVFGFLAGLLFILTMSKLYMLPAVPAWNRPFTPLSFFLTSAALGAAASSVFFTTRTMPPAGDRTMLAVAIAASGADFACATLLTPVFGVLRTRIAPSLKPRGGGPSLLFAVRVGMLLGGTILLAASVLDRGGGTVRLVLLLAAFSLIAAGETAGRFLFYALAGATKIKQIS